MKEPLEKLVGKRWVWLTDYAYFSAVWTIQCESGRKVEVGTGISILGKPRGGILKCRGYLNFETMGIGAIHVRVVDGQGDCAVRLDQGEVAAIDVYSDPSLFGDLRKKLSR